MSGQIGKPSASSPSPSGSQPASRERLCHATPAKPTAPTHALLRAMGIGRARSLEVGVGAAMSYKSFFLHLLRSLLVSASVRAACATLRLLTGLANTHTHMPQHFVGCGKEQCRSPSDNLFLWPHAGKCSRMHTKNGATSGRKRFLCRHMNNLRTCTSPLATRGNGCCCCCCCPERFNRSIAVGNRKTPTHITKATP